MTPDDIRVALAEAYPRLKAEPRQNPYGWSFFLDYTDRGKSSTRILRAVESRSKGPTKLKLAVSARHLGTKCEILFFGDRESLCKLVEEELDMFEKHRTSQ